MSSARIVRCDGPDCSASATTVKDALVDGWRRLHITWEGGNHAKRDACSAECAFEIVQATYGEGERHGLHAIDGGRQ